MKRILLAIVAVIMLGCMGAYAQSANRKGFFIDVQAGNTFGYVYKSYDGENYLKGGMDVELGLGYRFVTSMHWAFQMKAVFSDNLSATKLFTPTFMVGMRWTSNDFAGDKSGYLGFGSGVGFGVLARSCEFYVPIEIEGGINLTNKIGLGLYITPKFACNGEPYSVWEHPDRLKSNVVAGVKFSYRF